MLPDTNRNSERRKSHLVLRLLLIPLLLVIVLTACDSSQDLIIEEANLIIAIHGLKGNISLVKSNSIRRGRNESIAYNIYITLDDFENKSNQDIASILRQLESIKIVKIGNLKSTSRFISKAYIKSSDFVYNLNWENQLMRDGEVYPPLPTPTLFVYPAGDFSLSWDTYNSTYNSLGGILTITRRNGKYTMREVFKDGSVGIYELHVISETPSIQLTNRPGNPFGDYMEIASNGKLHFCDKNGFIFSASPYK